MRSCFSDRPSSLLDPGSSHPSARSRLKRRGRRIRPIGTLPRAKVLLLLGHERVSSRQDDPVNKGSLPTVSWARRFVFGMVAGALVGQALGKVAGVEQPLYYSLASAAVVVLLLSLSLGDWRR